MFDEAFSAEDADDLEFDIDIGYFAQDMGPKCILALIQLAHPFPVGSF